MMRLCLFSSLALLAGCASGDRGTGPADAGSREIGTQDSQLVDVSRPDARRCEATMCGAVCVDLLTSDSDCGACANTCAATEVCTAGMCIPLCAVAVGEPERTACGPECVDLESDPVHCGTCDNPCGAAQQCSGGTCEDLCDSGLTYCTEDCVDVTVNRNHCGTCGANCDPGYICTDSSCILECDAGLTGCGGTCRDTETDVAHCGACDFACEVGGMCTAGECVVERDIVFTFPSTGDTRVGSGSPPAYFWRLGDFVQGSRTHGLSRVTRVVLALQVSPNSLTCDTQDVRFFVDATAVATQRIPAGGTVVRFDAVTDFAVGPTSTFRLETTRQVSGGCGSAGYADNVSVLTLSGR